MPLSPFSFDARELNLKGPDDYIARIGPGIRTCDVLFEVLRRELLLPDYFGRNWDALSDCLRDLSWIKRRRVAILHAELPPLGDEDLSSYLDVLADSIRDWKRDDDHQLIVVFPEAARTVVSLIAERDRWKEGGSASVQSWLRHERR